MVYKDKKKYIIRFIMALIILGIGAYWISNNNNNKSTPVPKNAKSASSDSNKTKKTVEDSKKSNKNKKITISDEEIKTLLFNGYMIQRKLEETYLTVLQEVKIDSKEYKKIPDRFKDKQSIYNYCGEEFGLNKYYTEKYIESIVDYVLRDIKGKYYAIIGESGMYLIFENTKITSKKYSKNRLDITFTTDDEGDSYCNCKATLVKCGEKWLIDYCDFLIQ